MSTITQNRMGSRRLHSSHHRWLPSTFTTTCTLLLMLLVTFACSDSITNNIPSSATSSIAAPPSSSSSSPSTFLLFASASEVSSTIDEMLASEPAVFESEAMLRQQDQHREEEQLQQYDDAFVEEEEDHYADYQHQHDRVSSEFLAVLGSNPAGRRLLSITLANCTVNGTWTLNTDSRNCTLVNCTVNGTWTINTDPSNCTATSSTGAGPSYTGVWSCTPYSTCGFYPNCLWSRNCTCSGGTCDPAAQPLTTDTCPCQYTYSWGYGAWSLCSVSCGPGTQARSASCFRSDGTVVSNSYCGTPVISQSCSYGDCLAWVASGFGACQGSCGWGMQYQNVTCWDTTLNVAYAGACLGAGSQPLTSQWCALPHCYQWIISGWSSCPVTCGIGTQIRSVQCWDQTAGQYVSSAFCGTAPATSQPCSPDPPHCYAWQTGIYSACDHPDCGWGTKTRSVWCQDLTNNTVAMDWACPTFSKPVSSTSCKIADCYTWQANSWGGCSATCGVGYQTRTLTCFDLTTGSPSVVGNAPCGTPLNTTQICQPALNDCVQWQTAPWGLISTDCGPGTQTRDVYCYDFTLGAVVPDSTCSTILGTGKPVTIQAATNGNCYAWSVTNWGTCSVTCGSGTQTRVASCCDLTQVPGSCTPSIDANCLVKAAKPIESQGCTFGDCYAWQYSAYAGCSATCGSGTWTRSYWCQDITTSTLAPSNFYCSGALAALSTTCNSPTDIPYCTDNTLASITPSVGTLAPVFAAATTAYTIGVTSSVPGLTLQAFANEPHATVSYSPSSTVSGLVYGSPQVVTITCTAQSGSAKAYTVTISRAASTNSYLQTLSFDNSVAVLSPAFVSTLISYSVYVPDTVTSFNPVMTTQHASATTSYSWSPALPLVPGGGSSTLTITCTSQAGSSFKTVYTVSVQCGQHSVSYLASLAPGVSSLVPAFGQTTYVYTLAANIPYSTTTWGITGTLADSTATMSAIVNGGAGVTMTEGSPYNVALDVGDNIIGVKVLAQNQLNWNLYKITVHRLSNDASLAFLDTSASPNYVISPNFVPATLAYTLNVPASLSTLTVYATFNYKLALSTSTFTLVNSGGTLSSGGVCGGTCVMGTGTLPALTMLTGTNTLTMNMKSEDSSTTNSYVLTIHKYSSVSTMATFVFSGTMTTSPTFSSTTYSYNFVAPAATSATTITVTPTYSLAFCQYTFNGVGTTYVSLTNGSPSTSFPIPTGDIVLDVNCVSEDGLSSTLYVFNIHRLSTIATIQSLSISTNNIVPSFATGTYSYTSTTNAIAISLQLIPSSSYATFAYTWNGGGSVAGTGNTIAGLIPVAGTTGTNTLVITVKSEDASTTQGYTITIHKQSTDSSLSALSVSVGAIYPTFSSITADYTLTVAAATGSTTITASVNNQFASSGYTILAAAPTPALLTAATYTALPSGSASPAITLNTGKTYIGIAVSSEDTTQAKTYYTISIYRPQAGSTLYSLSTLHGVSANDYNPSPFVSSTLSYTMTLPNADSTLVVSTVTVFPLSTTTWSFQGSAPVSYVGTVPTQTIPIGDSVLIMICTAEDTSSITQYTIKIHRKSPIATLSFLGIQSGSGSVTPDFTPLFTPSTFTVSASVAQSVPNIIISATATYSLAVLQYSYNAVSQGSGPWNSFNTYGASLTLVLNTGDNVVYVRVISEDSSPTITNYYTINIHRYSSISTIHGMTMSTTAPSVAAVTFTPTFSPTTYTYRLTVASSVTAIGCTIVPESTLSVNTYSLAGSVAAAIPSGTTLTGLPVLSGDQDLNLYLLSEDGLTTNTYTITIHRVSTIVDLVSCVTSVGITTPVVNITQASNYYVMDISPTTTTLSFTPTLASLLSSLSYLSYQDGAAVPGYVGLNSGLSTGPLLMYEGHTWVQIKVVAEDNLLPPRVYVFNIHRISSNALLASITISGTDNQPWTPTFASNVFSYKVNTNPASSAFTFSITQQWALANTTYSYNSGPWSNIGQFVSSPSNPLLMADFAPSAGYNVLQLTVTAEDGITYNNYTFRFHRISNDANVVSFTPIPASAVLAPDVPANSWTVTVNNFQLSFAATPILSSAYTKEVAYIYHFGDQVVNEVWSLSNFTTYGASSGISYLAYGQSTQWAALAVGNNFIHFRVTAEDAVTQTLHTIKIHRNSTYTTLSNIIITPSGSGLIPAFSINTRTYTINLPNAISTFTLNTTWFYPIMTTVGFVYTNQAGTSNPNVVLGNAVASAPISIQVGTSTIVITCLAEDGVTSGIYTLKVNRISNDPTIASLTANPTSYGFIPAFNASGLNYILSLAPIYSTVSLTPTLSYPKASMLYQIYNSVGALVSSTAQDSGSPTPTLSLAVGNTTVKFVATAEDGFSTVTYVININRISTDSSIYSIAFNGYNQASGLIGPITPTVTPNFTINTLQYSMYLPNSVYKAAFSAFQNYPRADLTWSIGSHSIAATPYVWVAKSTLTPILDIQPGDNVFNFICVAQDTVTTTLYEFDIYREGDLSNLEFESHPTNIMLYPTPGFVEGLSAATISVSFLTEAIGIKATFFTLGSTTAWHMAAPGTKVVCINGTVSGSFPLTVGSNSIMIQNTKDPWNYTLTVIRAAPDLSDIQFVVSPGPALIYTPGNVFSSTNRNYSANVPFITDTIQVSTLYATSSSVVTVQIIGSGIDAQIDLSGSGITLPLKQGNNPVTIVSSLDGTYTYNINRLAPDLQTLVITGNRADGTVQNNIGLSPTFTGGKMAYTGVVVSVVRNISFSFTFNGVPQVTASTTQFGPIFAPINDLGTWVTTATETLTSGTPTAFYPINIGLNYFGIYSLRDGWYVFTINRGGADVGGIILTGYNWDGTTTVLQQVPTFVPNQLGPRNVNIRKTTLAYTITSLYLTDTSVTLLLNAGTSKNMTALNTTVVSNQPMGPYPLHTLTNTLNVLSTYDGGYLYNLYQELGDVKNITITTTTQDGIVTVRPTTPVFTSGYDYATSGYIYRITVPYRTDRLQFTATMITSSSAFLVKYIIPNYDCSFLNTINSTLIRNNTIAPIAGQQYALPVGVSLFALYSNLDGLYNHEITRLVPDIQSLTLTLNPGHPLNTLGANNWFSTSPAVFNFASNVYSYVGSVNYITEVIQLDMIVTSPVEYTLLFVDATGASFPYTISASPATFTLYPMVGSNYLTITCNLDGIYNYKIIRRPPDLQLTPTPPQINGFDRFGTLILSPSGAIMNSSMVPPLYTPVFNNFITSTSYVATPQLTYSLSVSYTVSFLAMKVNFLNALGKNLVSLMNTSYTSTNGNGVVVSGNTIGYQTLTTNVLSTRYDFPSEGVFTYDLSSQLDGVYKFVITRLPPDMIAFSLQGWTQGLAQSLNLPLTPTFDPHQYIYTLSVPFIVATFDMHCRHVRADATYKTTNLDSGVTTIASPTLQPITASTDYMDYILQLPLIAGQSNRYTLYSSLDGEYSISIYRALPVLRGIRVQAELLNQGVAFNSVDVQLPAPNTVIYTASNLQPPFTRGNYHYNLNVPFTVAQVKFQIEWSLDVLQRQALDIALVSGLYSASGADAFHVDGGAMTPDYSVNNLTYSLPYNLVCWPSTNTVRFLSTLDGNYTITITRDQADITNVVLYGASNTNPLVPVPFQQIYPTPAWSRPVATTDPRVFTISLPWLWSDFQLMANFVQFSSVTLYDTNNITFNLVSGIASTSVIITRPNPLDYAQTVSEYKLLSLQDGLYRFIIYRAAPDLRDVQVWPSFVTCDNSSDWMIGTRLKWNQVVGPVQTDNGLFTPAKYYYKSQVQYAVTGVAMQAICGTTWASNVQIWMQNSLAPTATYVTYTCNSTVGSELGTSNDLPLVLGGNTLWIQSDADGLFQFDILRLPATMSKVAFTGYTMTTPSFSAAFQLVNPSLFTPGQFYYTVELPYVSDRMSFNFTQVDNAQLYLYSAEWQEIQDLGFLDNLNLGSSVFNLNEGPNIFELRSSLDGCYTFNVTRKPASWISALDVTLTQPYQIVEDQIALADFAGRDLNTQIARGINTSYYIAAGTQNALAAQLQGGYDQFCGCDGTGNGSTLLYPQPNPLTPILGTPRIFTFNPFFMGGWIGPYQGDVIESQSSIDWSMTFASGEGSAISCSINSVSFATLPSLYVDNTTLTASVPLQIGANLILCDSDDGTYIFHITRGNGTWSLPAMPYHLYANQVITGLRLAPVGVSNLKELNLAVVITQGTISPSYFPVASSLLTLLTNGESAAYFTYTAPMITTQTIDYITFVRTGIDAWAFDLAPIWNVTILPQTTLIYSGISPVSMYYSLQTTPTIALTPTQATNAGGITVTITLVDLDTQEVFPQAVLNFGAFSASPLTFQMQIPLTPVNRSTVMRTAISGPDQAHYIIPSDVPLFIDSRSDLVFSGWTPTFFVSQAREISVTPSEAPDQDVYLTMTLLDSGAVFLPDQHTVYGYDYAAALASGTSQTFTLHFPAHSQTPQWFVIQVLPALSVPSIDITVNFSITGVDFNHYFPIANHTFTVLQASQMSLVGIPTQLTNRGVSSPVTIALADPPPTNVTVTIVVEGGGGPTPESVTYLSSQVSQQWIFNAPYWYTGVPHGIVYINISFVLSGIDAGMYYVPAPIVVEIVQIAADVRAVQFFARGADNVDTDMTDNISPFIGNHLYYEQQLNIAVMDTGVRSDETPSRRRLLSDDGSSNHGTSRMLLSTTTPQGANVSVAARAVFVTGATVFVQLDNSFNGVVTTSREQLTSGVMSSYFDLMEGTNYFHINSSLDGPYVFKFQTNVVDASVCIAQSDAKGLSPYGLPTQSFVGSTSDLIATTGQKNITNSTVPQVLLCTTIPGVQQQATQLRQDALNAPAVSRSLTSNVATSWVFLALMGMYFSLAVSSGIAVGRRKLLAHQVTDDFESFTLSAPGVEENVVQKAGRFGRVVVRHTRTFLIATMCFSLPHLLLIACTLRSFDMMLYHSFTKSFTLQIFRLLVGFPHIFLPWIMTAVFQQCRILLRYDNEVPEAETNDDGIPGIVTTKITMLNPTAEAIAEPSLENKAPTPGDQSIEHSVEPGSPQNLELEPSKLGDKVRNRSLIIRRAAGPVAPPNKARLFYDRLMMPQHPLALYFNAVIAFVFLADYAVITFVIKDVPQQTNFERYMLSVLAFVVGFLVLCVFGRTQSETLKAMKALKAGEVVDADTVRKRKNAWRAMMLMVIGAGLSLVLLLIVVDHTDITKSDFQTYIVPFSLFEGFYIAMILWLLHGAIREQRRRMIKIRNTWRQDNLLDGMRIGKNGQLLLDGEEDSESESEFSSSSEGESEEEEGDVHITVPTEAPSAVDILLDSAAYTGMDKNGPRSWNVPTATQTAAQIIEKKERLHAWLLFADIFGNEAGDSVHGSAVDLSDNQIEKLIEHGHGTETLGPALKGIQDAGLKFAGVPDLLAYLDRLKSEKEAMEAKLAEEMAEIMVYVNQSSDILKKLPKHDGTPNGQSMLTVEDSVRGLEPFLRSIIETSGLIPTDPDQMEQIKTRAREAMLDACKNMQACAKRFPNTEAFLTALKEPVPATSEIQAIRTANLRVEDAQKIVNYVNEETNLLRPKRGRLLLTLVDAELILGIVSEQTYPPSEYAYPNGHSSKDDSSSSSPAFLRPFKKQLSVSSLPVPTHKGRLLKPIKPRLPGAKFDVKDSALPEEEEGKSTDASPDASRRGSSSIEGLSFIKRDEEGVPSSDEGRKLRTLPTDRTPLVDDIISRLGSWQDNFMKFDTVDKLVDAFRTPVDTTAVDALRAEEAKAEEERQAALKAAEAKVKAEAEAALAAKIDALAAKVDQLAAEKTAAAERAEQAERAQQEAQASRLSEAEQAKLSMAEELRLMKEAAAAERAAADAALAALHAQHAAEKAALEAEKAQAEERAREEALAKAKAEAEAAEAKRLAEEEAQKEADRLAFEMEQRELARMQEEAEAAAEAERQREEEERAQAEAAAKAKKEHEWQLMQEAAEREAQEEKAREEARIEAEKQAAHEAELKAAREEARQMAEIEAEMEAKRAEEEAAAALAQEQASSPAASFDRQQSSRQSGDFTDMSQVGQPESEMDSLDQLTSPTNANRRQPSLGRAPTISRNKSVQPIKKAPQFEPLAPAPIVIKNVKKVFGFGSGQGKQDAKLTAEELRLKRIMEIEKKKKEREEAAIAAFQLAVANKGSSSSSSSNHPGPVTISLAPAPLTSIGEAKPSRRNAALAGSVLGTSPASPTAAGSSTTGGSMWSRLRVTTGPPPSSSPMDEIATFNSTPPPGPASPSYGTLNSPTSPTPFSLPSPSLSSSLTGMSGGGGPGGRLTRGRSSLGSISLASPTHAPLASPSNNTPVATFTTSPIISPTNAKPILGRRESRK